MPLSRLSYADRPFLWERQKQTKPAKGQPTHCLATLIHILPGDPQRIANVHIAIAIGIQKRT